MFSDSTGGWGVVLEYLYAQFFLFTQSWPIDILNVERASATSEKQLKRRIFQNERFSSIVFKGIYTLKRFWTFRFLSLSWSSIEVLFSFSF